MAARFEYEVEEIREGMVGSKLVTFERPVA